MEEQNGTVAERGRTTKVALLRKRGGRREEKAPPGVGCGHLRFCFCESQRTQEELEIWDSVDNCCMKLFPSCFLAFNLIYWYCVWADYKDIMSAIVIPAPPGGAIRGIGFE